MTENSQTDKLGQIHIFLKMSLILQSAMLIKNHWSGGNSCLSWCNPHCFAFLMNLYVWKVIYFGEGSSRIWSRKSSLGLQSTLEVRPWWDRLEAMSVCKQRGPMTKLWFRKCHEGKEGGCCEVCSEHRCKRFQRLGLESFGDTAHFCLLIRIWFIWVLSLSETHGAIQLS